MSEIKLTQLYDKEGNALFPNMYLKTINGQNLFAEGSPSDEDYGQRNNITITGGGEQTKVRIVYVYTATNGTPLTPEGGNIDEGGNFYYPNDWYSENEARSILSENEGYRLWRSYATLMYGAEKSESIWSEPSIVNEATGDGIDGKDGSDIKFIYCLTKENKKPTSYVGAGDNFISSDIKGEWSDEPMGIDTTWKYEWVSMSIKESGYNMSFGPFSDPIIWSRWGEDGRDGAGVEYIYRLNNENIPPDISYNVSSEEYQTSGYKPQGWTYDYESPTYDNRYSWVAIRKYKDNKWEDFSSPKLWNVYKVAGKSFADLYRRSDHSLSATDLPNYQGEIYYVYSTDKYYEDASLNNEITTIDGWHTDIPNEGDKYLFKTQAYVNIIDIDKAVAIDKSVWCGPYFVSADGENGENAIAESAYLQMTNDSFSLPITSLNKTHLGIDYVDTIPVKLMYGDDELVIDSSKIEYKSDLFDYVNPSISNDNKTLTVSFKIKNDVYFSQVENITVELSGVYNEVSYTAKKSFRIIPYISTANEFFKIRINDDTIYVPQDENILKGVGNIEPWSHIITVSLVNSRGESVNIDDINCKFVYGKNNEKINEGGIKLVGHKDAQDKEGYNNYILVSDLSNPLEIKLIDKDTNAIREIEYVDFINIPRDGSNGTPGSPGSPGVSSRTVFAYYSTGDSSIAPNTPINGSVNFETNKITYPIDPSTRESWSDMQDLGGIVWLSTKEFFSDSSNSDASWNKPMRITGEKGEAGVDGTSIEFAYHLCKSIEDYGKMSSPSDGSVTYHPEENVGKDDSQWTDSPQGIDPEYIIEACSQRTYSENDGWSDWSKPFIWSRWGEDGTDGDGVEYIFKVVSKEIGESIKQSVDTINSYYDKDIYKDVIQTDDFCPNEEWLRKYVYGKDISYEDIADLNLNWSDQPRDVSDSEPYEYVSIRKKKNGVWQFFSDPILWNEWHRDGYDTYTEFAFTSIPSNDTLSGYKVKGGTYNNPLNDLITCKVENETEVRNDISWSDTIPAYNEGYSIWMISSFFTSNKDSSSHNGNWTSPSKMMDSQTLQVEYSNSEYVDASNITQLQDIWKGESLDELENKFRSTETERKIIVNENETITGVVWGDENIISPTWMATSRLINGQWTKWVVTRIKGERGPQGDKGEAGTSVTFKGSFDKIEELQDAYEYWLIISDEDESNDNSIEEPTKKFQNWELTNGDGYLVEGNLWVYNGTRDIFANAWTNVGQIKGEKGDSYYLYIAYSNDDSSAKILTGDRAPYGTVPGKYIGVYVSLPMEEGFPSDNTKYSNWFTWSKWKGEDGFGQEQIFKLSESSICSVPSIPNDSSYSIDEWNAQDFVPKKYGEGWSDTPLTPTLTHQYCVMAVRQYPAKEYKNGYNLFKGDASNNAIIFSYLAKDGSGGLDGTSPFHIELSNSYDQVYVVDNVVEVEQEVSTNIKVFKGSEDITNKVNISVNNDASYKDGVVKKVFNAGNPIDASTKELIYTITVAQDPSIGLDYPLQSVFKIVKLNGNIDYDLEVYPPYITVATNDDNKYSNDTINIKVTKSNISTTERNTTYVNELPGYFINYNIDGVKLHSTSYNSSEGITLDSSIVKSIKNYIKIELKDGSTTIDNYTVEILRDGKNGEDGKDAVNFVHVEMDNEFDLVKVDGDNKSIKKQTFTSNLRLIEGNEPTEIKTITFENINGIDASYKITDSSSTIAEITFNVSSGVSFESNKVIPVKVGYESEYDLDETPDEAVGYFILKPISSMSEIYQLDVRPGYLNYDGVTTDTQNIYARVYKKSDSGIEYVDASTFPEGFSIKYMFNNDSSSLKTVTINENTYNKNLGVKVYTYDSSNLTYKKDNKDVSINEIDVILYKDGSILYDNINVEVKDVVKPAAIFDITPTKSVVYLDNSANIIPTTLKFTPSFSYNGKKISTTNCDISVKDGSGGNVDFMEVSKGVTSINVSLKNASMVSNVGKEVEYYFEIKYANNTYQKPFIIQYVKSSLTITSLFDTLQISSYKKKYIQDGGSESASDMFEFDVYFNDKNVTSDCEISLVSTNDASMNNYINNGGIFFNYRGNNWYMNYILKDSSTYDITNFIKNKGTEAKITMKFTYDGISVEKEWYLTTTEINSNYLSIQCSPQRIMDSNENSPIEMYIEEGVVNYVSIEDLIDKYKMTLWYSIDNGEYIEINKNTTIAKSRGNYAFYPNGLIIYDATGGEIRQEPILKEIKFRILDASNNLVDVQSVERIDILQDTYLAKIQPNSNGISLSDLFDGVNYTSDMDVIIL